MPPAANIDQAIQFAEFDIAAQAYAAVESTYTNMVAWIAGIFSEATGIFPPSADPPQSGVMGQRVITDWLAQSLMARDAIESQAIGGAGPVGVSAVINVVVRVLYAVKFAVVNGQATAGQQTAVVALYNVVWQ